MISTAKILYQRIFFNNICKYAMDRGTRWYPGIIPELRIQSLGMVLHLDTAFYVIGSRVLSIWYSSLHMTTLVILHMISPMHDISLQKVNLQRTTSNQIIGNLLYIMFSEIQVGL